MKENFCVDCEFLEKSGDLPPYWRCRGRNERNHITGERDWSYCDLVRGGTKKPFCKLFKAKE